MLLILNFVAFFSTGNSNTDWIAFWAWGQDILDNLWKSIYYDYDKKSPNGCKIATNIESEQIIKNISKRPLVKSVYQKMIFLISQPKQMLWVLKRTVSMRRFF